MSTAVPKPHDKLFRAVFGDTREAESFLCAYLPVALAERLEWPTLSLVETSFVDEALRESESDLLYSIQVAESAHPALLYLLFEHQSKPDPWMRFRLLKYMCRIWDESFKESPAQSELRPIIPVVFYQGESGWHYSTEFADLFPVYAAGTWLSAAFCPLPDRPVWVIARSGARWIESKSSAVAADGCVS